VTTNISVLMVRNILLVTVPTDPTDEVIAELQEAVLDEMMRKKARGLILDIATVEILDSYFARTLSETAQMVQLMGGTTVLTGMRPTVAITVTELGLQMEGTLTALNVDRAIERLEENWVKDGRH
jgi:rsbT antagonist protein RsbS